MWSILRTILPAFTLLAASTPIASAEPKVTVEEVAAAIRANRDAIHSIDAEYTITQALSKSFKDARKLVADPPPQQIRWLQKGETVRLALKWRELRDDDAIFKDGIWKNFSQSTRPGQGDSLLIASEKGGPDSFNNLWNRVLFDVVAGKSKVQIEDYLRSNASAAKIAEIEMGGRKFVQVELPDTNSKGKLTLHLDPTKNYLVVRAKSQPTEGESTSDLREVLETKEPVPGLFFPVRIERSTFNLSGQLRARVTTSIAKLRVNEFIDDATFSRAIPENTFVEDTIEGKTFTLGKDGKPVAGTVKPLRQPFDIQQQIDAQKKPWYAAWWVWALAAVAFVAGVLALRHLRGRTGSSSP